MGLEADGSPSICGSYPDCCDGNVYFLNEFINQTFAQTHWYCYPEGHPPNWTNGSNSTNLTGIIFERPIDTNDYGIEASRRAYEKYLAEQKRLYVDIPILLSQISGAFSIFTCTIVIGIFIAILIYQPIIARRCSLRLSVAVSIADMIFSYNQAIPANDFDDWRCTAQAVVQVWAELCSLFFTSAIALNLLLVFVFEFNNTKKIEPLYYAIPLLLATCIVAYPLYKSWFGYDYWNCFFRYEYNSEYNRDSEANKLKYAAKVNEITWIFYTSWMCACIVWCAFVVLSFWITITEKNRKKQKAASKLGSSSQGEQSTSGVQSSLHMTSNGTTTGTSSVTATGSRSTAVRSGGSGSNETKRGKSGTGTNKIEEKSQKMIQKAVMRIAFYPVVPLITALPLALALSIIKLTEIYQFGWFSSIMSNLQGFGNSCIFYFDPAVSLARETFRKYMTEKYVLKYHPILENGSRSIRPVQLGNLSDFKEVGSIFMYHFAKLFAARKRDFIVENTKKKGASKTDTAVNSQSQQSKKMAIMDDDNKVDVVKKKDDGFLAVESQNPPSYGSYVTDQSMATSATAPSSAVDSTGYYPVQSYTTSDAVVSFTDPAASAVNGEDIQVDQVVDDEEEINEDEILKDISNF